MTGRKQRIYQGVGSEDIIIDLSFAGRYLFGEVRGGSKVCRKVVRGLHEIWDGKEEQPNIQQRHF